MVLQALEVIAANAFYVWKLCGDSTSGYYRITNTALEGPFRSASEALGVFRREFALATGYEWEKRFASPPPPPQTNGHLLWLETDPVLPLPSSALQTAAQERELKQVMDALASRNVSEPVANFLTKLFCTSGSVRFSSWTPNANFFWFQMVSFVFIQNQKLANF